MKSFDVFLSYNWDVKPAVTALYHELAGRQGLKVWMDEFEMGQHRLVEELSMAICQSTVFVCCITKKYTESENCKDEIDYARNIKKPMVVLMFERHGMEELGGVGFTIGSKVRFNCYKHPEMFQNWSNETFDGIMAAIRENLNAVVSVGSIGPQKDTLHSNESLLEEIYLTSISKQYFALVQTDGNFVLYKSNDFKRDKPLWASNTYASRNPRPFKLTLLKDGNLVLFDKNGQAVWTSNSENKGANGSHKLVLQNDGNLVLYDGQMSPIWATNTWKN